MVEYDNVREALADALEMCEASEIKIDGKDATVTDVQESIKERLINIADLLGVSELYLGE
ncbi:hypothetical protein P7D98_14930 [Enterococcus avium]|uniref:hypothetical protein n=1 Tax=Enterococcus avium TaxID=33945 RepID=UPI002891E7A1|nr:hypothetical protein [Enterococcus avium]MDT2436827.1 hypothetical protein [Enterococcus avium]MDT2466978.1 hypothetical protein [Enterococcus avium]MDT2485273.1 hypothetical protein [Enterococcus avium]MDT2506378.1 hypothetical protein [Enterococcus avium]MDT2511865.1 hypothetical protein [Enterococcus avium]